VLKKTSASIGLVIAAAAGAPLTSPSAHATMLQGGWHSHHRFSHHSHHRNRNWNGNRHRSRIFIRIYIYNKNNNHAVALARPERRETRPASLTEDRPFFRVPSRADVTRRVARPVEPEAPAAPADAAGTGAADPNQVSTVPAE
jgi:hypothetical protein